MQLWMQFCQGCAKNWEYMTGNGQCPKCEKMGVIRKIFKLNYINL